MVPQPAFANGVWRIAHFGTYAIEANRSSN